MQSWACVKTLQVALLLYQNHTIIRGVASDSFHCWKENKAYRKNKQVLHEQTNKSRTGGNNKDKGRAAE